MTWKSVVLTDDVLIDDVFANTSRGTRIFECEADTQVAPEDAFTANDGTVAVPGIGDAWSDARPACKMRTRSTKRRSPFQITVTCNFEDPTIGQVPGDLLKLAAVITVNSVRELEEYAIDRSDPPKPVRNSSGEPFGRNPAREINQKVYSIVKYVNAATKSNIENAEHTTNMAPLTIDGRIWDTDHLFLSNAAFEEVAGMDGVWRATMEIGAKTNEVGWLDQALDYAFTKVVNDESDISKHREQILEKDYYGRWVPVTRPWPMHDGQPMDDPDGTPDTLTFRPYVQASWSGVPLA